MMILGQFDISATGITILHFCSQCVIRNQLTVISVNPSFSTYPHSTILCLNNRIDTRTGQSIICIEIGNHEHISGNMPVCRKNSCQQQQYK